MPQFADKDACELLDADHIAVKHLFVDYARLATAGIATDDSGAQRTALAMKICDELTIHATIEEEIFYPALRQALPDTAEMLDEAVEEHQDAKELIADIRAIGTANASMDTLIAELNVVIEHHVKEERDDLFPKAKAEPKLDLVALGKELLSRQQQLHSQMEASPSEV
jgi:iron-sulfur cluster repair protein YtfE (RIC family)